MKTVFIVRPFGSKRPVIKKRDDGSLEIIKYDFDRVEKELIKPAMREVGLKGGTTGEVFAAGDIREDMFSSLLMADLVIADISVHNANVFYELGIRNALRSSSTILIKSEGFDATPFDIVGYRYVSYDYLHPEKSLEELIRTINETIIGERIDSPVFNVLPTLEEQENEKFLAVPEDYISEADLAFNSNFPGKLAMLGMEAAGFTWEFPALKYIGGKLFKLKRFELARGFFEKVLKQSRYKRDLLCCEKLATILQRLAEKEFDGNKEKAVELLNESSQFAEKVIKSNESSKEQKAEAFALLGRNHKTQWLWAWRGKPNPILKALESVHLRNALENYEKGFMLNLNHYYSGINVLGLSKIVISLGKLLPDTWEVLYEKPEREMEELEKKHEQLSNTLKFSLEAGRKEVTLSGNRDLWLDITEVDYQFLTSERSRQIASKYKRILENADELTKSSCIRQIHIFKDLGILGNNVNAVLEELGEVASVSESTMHYLLFTGHMIDIVDRETPRFPASKEHEVSITIKSMIEKIKLGNPNDKVLGIAGGANGGDIIFHEQCRALGIETIVFVAFDRDEYKKASVLPGGNKWGVRFDNLLREGKHYMLNESKELPNWLKHKKGYSIWQRNNLWELNFALKDGASNMTLLALWDGKKADGPGGTEDMVEQVRNKGGRVEVIGM